MERVRFKLNHYREYDVAPAVEGWVTITSTPNYIVKQIFDRLPYNKDANDKLTSFLRDCTLEGFEITEARIPDTSDRTNKLSKFLWLNDDDSDDVEVPILKLYSFGVSTTVEFLLSRFKNKLQLTYALIYDKKPIMTGAILPAPASRKELHLIFNKQKRLRPNREEIIAAMHDFCKEREQYKDMRDAIRSLQKCVDVVSTLNLSKYSVIQASYESTFQTFILSLVGRVNDYSITIKYGDDVTIHEYGKQGQVEISRLP